MVDSTKPRKTIISTLVVSLMGTKGIGRKLRELFSAKDVIRTTLERIVMLEGYKWTVKSLESNPIQSKLVGLNWTEFFLYWTLTQIFESRYFRLTILDSNKSSPIQKYF